MKQTAITLLTGVLFGAGLALSDMVNPARVIAFLDIFGAWDPALAFVMGGAIIPSSIAFILSKKMRQPLLDGRFFIPENTIIDRQLIYGATLFGAGWGLVGYCPGPAIAGLALGQWQPLVFVIAMLVGMWVHRYSNDLREARKAA